MKLKSTGYYNLVLIALQDIYEDLKKKDPSIANTENNVFEDNGHPLSERFKSVREEAESKTKFISSVSKNTNVKNAEYEVH